MGSWAIYTRANHERSSEIWQYIYVIHTVASANPWDNVYYYDINFRELMASKPWRSSGETYTQGWNMAFNNSNITNTGAGGNYNSSHFNNSSGSSGQSGRNMSSNKSWKDDCCWRYNKNKCNRTNQEFRYDHRCTYCAGWNHGFHNCRKRNNKQQKRLNNPNLKSNSPSKNENTNV